ncbi:hypothetical protein LOD99_2873 [Oopsacas minuta]|uniref:DOMON domain-containing protein n=1 Tax=Oopsacas minuta TaxID=111878 RepID=A0AAV7K188_9METZ|nr:hypothetical protein LOD99_2873 [Oopsacas minuta]
MSKILILILLLSCLGVIHANDLIGVGCDDDTTCIQFSNCAVNTAPTTPNIGTFTTIDDTTVQFQLQYDNAAADWIAMGLSTTQSMPNSNIFMCVRSGANVNLQERFASARARPPEVTSDLTLINSINDASIINCTFNTNILGSPNLNRGAGYYVLLAWGTVSGGSIQQHGGASRCVSSNEIVITTATGIDPTTPTATTPSATTPSATTPSATNPSATTQPSNLLIGERCGTMATCIQFSNCAVNTAPTTPNIGTIYTIDNTTVQFQLQYDNPVADWIAMGLSTTRSMPNSFIFMCVRSGVDVVVLERFASARARPPEVTSDLTLINSINDASIINCTFTTNVLGSPNLNRGAGYYVLLAWGTVSGGLIQQHGSAGRCVTSSEIVITTATGGAPVFSLAISTLVLMLTILFLV